MKPVTSKRNLVSLASSMREDGFSLIEVVIGIVVTAFALTFITTLFFSNPERSVEPLLQIRAAEFGQALMDEILSKSFDETTPVGGVPLCLSCTDSANFGPDGAEERANFNDVDDYHSYCTVTPVEDVFGETPPGFGNYLMSVCVVYDGDYDGIADNDTNAKLIAVDIFPPSGAGLGNPITFTAYRGNF